MEFEAIKMDGLGNDFVIVDQRVNKLDLSKDQIIRICDRSFIGCDQLIYINNSKEADAEVVFFNSDGSRSDACGNGTRCIAYLLSIEKNKKNIDLMVASKVLSSKIFENNVVETAIGSPTLEWDKIPLTKNLDTRNLSLGMFDINGEEIKGGIAVNVGNPHIIFFCQNIKNIDIKKYGPLIENHELFPKKCNVTIAQKINDQHYTIKVWERGAGLTKACGTAACATSVAANLNKLENSETKIEFSTGILNIHIDEKLNIKMKGPVSEIESIKIKI
tara:strand:- start:8880 stop:9704 length:825 start_codon:yes stop_codon:yes gene_type:complete